MARGTFISRDERLMIAVLAASGHTDSDIAMICGRDRSAVSRWVRRLKVSKPATDRPCPVPPDFIALADTTRVEQLAGRYERSPRTIRRWRKTSGIKPVRFPRTIRDTKRAKRRGAAIAWSATYDQCAANTLRRKYSMVFRCDMRLSERNKSTYGSVRGLPDMGRGHWYIGGIGILTHEAMIAKARDMGFEA